MKNKSSKDKELINQVKNIMKASNEIELTYSTKDVIKLFNFMYPVKNIPYLERKWKILNAGISSLGS